MTCVAAGVVAVAGRPELSRLSRAYTDSQSSLLCDAYLPTNTVAYFENVAFETLSK